MLTREEAILKVIEQSREINGEWGDPTDRTTAHEEAKEILNALGVADDEIVYPSLEEWER